MKRQLWSRVGRVTVALVAGFVLAVPSLGAQATGTITGRVTDAGTAGPLASAQVSIPGLNIGVLTQQNGRYILLNVPAGTHTVNVQRIGFRPGSETITVVAGESVTQDFSLAQEALALDEIIVTGTPGGTQRRAIGNAVSSVDASEVTDRQAVANVEQLLGARTPGVNLQAASGNVGSGTQIQIRGVSSLELGSQPLIYVDGVRIDNDATLGPAGGYAPGGAGRASALNDFNPQDIESIEIIKGPAAATLYGTEASAGVIQIITKKGRSGAPEFEFSTRQGANFMQDPGGVLGPKYACAGGKLMCSEEDLIEYDAYEVANEWVRQTGWRGADALFRNGHNQGYNLSVRGGTDQVRYYLSGDYTDNEGIVFWNYDESLRLRGNVSVLFGENMTVDVSTGFTQGETRFEDVPGEGGVFHDLVWTRYSPGRNPDPATVFNDRLPTATEKVETFRDYNRFTGSMTANHTWNFLTQRLIFGLDRSWDTNSQLIPYDPNGKYAGSYDPATQTGGVLTYARPTVANYTVDYAVSGNWAPTEALALTTSVGAQYYFEDQESLTNTGRNFGTPLQTTINQTAAEQLTLGYTAIQNKSLGVYVQEQVGWNDRVFLTAAVRADDNSAFGSEFDLEYYPKVSLAWVLSEEPFWNVAPINSLRLRGAWGKAGRQPSTFAGVTTYQTFTGPAGPGITPSSPGNPVVGPEVSTEIELGFDAAFFNDRLSGEFTWFDRIVEDALVDQPLAPSLGVPGQLDANLGELAVWGWEFALNALLYESDNVGFDLSFRGDHTRNEIVALGDNVLETANFQLGFPYPNVTSPILVSADLVRPGVATNAMCDRGTADGRPGGEVVPCGQLEGFETELLLGPAFPTHTFAISPTLTLFEDLQVFALADASYGRWIADINTQYAGVYRNTRPARLRTDPLFVAAYGGVGDDRYMGRVQADYWKLRELGARYNLPQSLVSRVGGDRASLSLTGRNLFYLWKRNDTDLSGQKIIDLEAGGPTSATAAVGLWTLPSISSVTATLRVTF